MTHGPHAAIIRTGTTAEWAASGLVLRDGEPGIDSTLDALRFGDGESLFADLPDSGGTALDLGAATAAGFADVNAHAVTEGSELEYPAPTTTNAELVTFVDVGDPVWRLRWTVTQTGLYLVAPTLAIPDPIGTGGGNLNPWIQVTVGSGGGAQEVHTDDAPPDTVQGQVWAGNPQTAAKMMSIAAGDVLELTNADADYLPAGQAVSITIRLTPLLLVG